ncbi:MAG: hypothetical protein QM751_09315 [Paludibacteraceae bacterium]
MSYIEKVNAAIKKIERLGKSKGHYYEQVLFELSNIEKLPIIIYRLEANELFFRTRINNGNNYETFADLSYPDEKYISSYARANKPLQQMFYCSENRPTSYIELLNSKDGNVGDEITLTIGCWQLVEPVDVVLVFDPSKARDNEYNQTHGAGYDNFIEQTQEEFREGTKLLFEFIGSYFGKQANDKCTYMLTTAYSNLVFTHDMVEGIIYPSVPFGGNGFNVAFFPKIMDDNRLRLLDVMKNVMKIELNENGKFNFVEQSATRGIINYADRTITWP